jgi:CHAT domain-containing protein
MLIIRLVLSLTLALSSTLAFGQCITVDDIRNRMADSTFLVEIFMEELHGKCPTAADSLGPAFASRSLYFNGLKDRRQAIQFGELALEQLRLADTTLLFGKTVYNLGLFNLWEGNAREAAYYFLEASLLFPKIDHEQRNRRWLQSLEDLGYTYTLTGDYERAEETLLLLMRKAMELGFPVRKAQANVKLGDMYIGQERWGAAAGALEGAIAGFAKAGAKGMLGGSRVSRATMNYKRGLMGAAQVEIDALLADNEDLSYLDYARALSLGVLLASRGKNLSAAEELYFENLAIANELKDAKVIAQAYDNGGEAALEADNFLVAIERFSTAITVLTSGYVYSEETPVPTANQLAASAYKIDLLAFLADLAKALEKAGKPDEAIAALYAADEVADQLRAGLGGEVSKLFWRGEALPVYEHAVRLAHERQQPEVAFFFFEKSRAILLLEVLAKARAMDLLPREATKQLYAAEEKLRMVQRAILAAEAPNDSLRTVLSTAREEILSLRKKLADEYPRAMIVPEETEVVDLATARQNLAVAGIDMQLQYFVGEQRTYLLVLDGAQIKTHDLGPSDALEKNLRPMLAYFEGPGVIDGNPIGFLRSAFLAHQTLIAPAAAPQNAALLVIPDGILAYLPFAAFVTSRSDDLASAPYMIRENPVSYAQSATLFGRQTATEGTGALSFSPFSGGLNPELALPASAKETDALSALYKTDVLAGSDATREALLNLAVNPAILHLGTHAYANRSGKNPARILTATSPLFLPDVYGLHLRGELVTLSACHSNIGPLAKGEGVLGLGRAFRAAGASGVVASLWPLNDASTVHLTGGFYQHLADGQTKPMALHQSQLDYLDKTDIPTYLKSPYYWAGLTYYGESGTVAADGIGWWVMWLALLVVICGLGWFWTQRG